MPPQMITSNGQPLSRVMITLLDILRQQPCYTQKNIALYQVDISMQYCSSTLEVLDLAVNRYFVYTLNQVEKDALVQSLFF